MDRVHLSVRRRPLRSAGSAGRDERPPEWTRETFTAGARSFPDDDAARLFVVATGSRRAPPDTKGTTQRVARAVIRESVRRNALERGIGIAGARPLHSAPRFPIEHLE